MGTQTSHKGIKASQKHVGVYKLTTEGRYTTMVENIGAVMLIYKLTMEGRYETMVFTLGVVIWGYDYSFTTVVTMNEGIKTNYQ